MVNSNIVTVLTVLFAPLMVLKSGPTDPKGAEKVKIMTDKVKLYKKIKIILLKSNRSQLTN